ncbi:MAG: thiolase domain-containing protein [bacterium]
MQVAVIGVGQTPFGLFPKRNLKSLFFEAFQEALQDVEKGLDPKEIQEAWIGTLSTGGGQLGNQAALLCETVGLVGISAHHVENACASGGFAFRNAVLAIRSGACRLALAGGIEKMSDLPRERNRLWLGVSGDVEWERLAGTNFPGIYAMLARRHMHEHGTLKQWITGVAVKNHANALHNPKAQLRFALDLDRALNSPMLADPLTVFDACPITDGAAVAILCCREDAFRYTDRPVWVMGSGAGTDYLAIHDRKDLTGLAAARKAALEAYHEASVGPDEIQVAEVHDCFTIAEIMAYEDLGFCKDGEGGFLIRDNITSINGPRPVNPSGGLKAKGHPIGATGIGQICEMVHQLRGDVMEPLRQVRGARFGLTHNVGGSGGTAVVHVFRAPK